MFAVQLLTRGKSGVLHKKQSIVRDKKKKKMSESDDERDSSYKTTKIPKFSGEEDDWDIWMSQFIAILGNKGLAKLLTYEGEIPRDDETFEAVEGDSEGTKKTKKQRKKLLDANSNAFSLLIATGL